jgi:hypothetical protein
MVSACSSNLSMIIGDPYRRITGPAIELGTDRALFRVVILEKDLKELFLVENFRIDKAFQVGKLILHVGDLHGLHELPLKVLLQGQLQIFHMS